MKPDYLSLQFGLWLAIVVPVFVVVVSVLEALAVSPFWAFTAGVAFDLAINPLLEELLEQREEEREGSAA